MTYFTCSAAPLGRVPHSVRRTGAGGRAGAGLPASEADPVFVAGALGSFDDRGGKLTGHLAPKGRKNMTGG